MKNSKSKTLRERLRSKRGFAMEYVIIVLLVAAAVVGLVMVFGGNLRNMFSAVNDATSAQTVGEVNDVEKGLNANRQKLSGENQKALKSSNKVGGVDVSGGGKKGGGKKGK